MQNKAKQILLQLADQGLNCHIKAPFTSIVQSFVHAIFRRPQAM